MELDGLQKEYDILLNQYQEAGKHYIALLETPSVANELVSLTGRTWWGEKGLAEGHADTQEECQSMCANSAECSGATFHSAKRYCWTRAGNSSITEGTPDQVALVKRQQEALSQMTFWNEQLIALNERMQPNLGTKDTEKDKDVSQELFLSYQRLLEQRAELAMQQQELRQLEQDEIDQQQIVAKQSMILKGCLFLTLLVFLLTLSHLFGTDWNLSWIAGILVLVLMSYWMKTPSGLVMWIGLLVALFALKRFGESENGTSL